MKKLIDIPQSAFPIIDHNRSRHRDLWAIGDPINPPPPDRGRSVHDGPEVLDEISVVREPLKLKFG